MENNAKNSPEWRRTLTGSDLERYERIKSEFKHSANVFRQVRMALGLSQVEAARLLKTTQANVSKIEARPETDYNYLHRLMVASGGSFSFVITSPDGKRLEVA